MAELSVERIERAYDALAGTEALIGSQSWCMVGIDEAGRPVIQLDPMAAVVYAERADAQIDPDDLDLGVVADALGLSADHVEGFYHGTAGHALDEAVARCADGHYLTSAEAVTEFERGHAEGMRVRRALFSA